MMPNADSDSPEESAQNLTSLTSQSTSHSRSQSTSQSSSQSTTQSSQSTSQLAYALTRICPTRTRLMKLTGAQNLTLTPTFLSVAMGLILGTLALPARPTRLTHLTSARSLITPPVPHLLYLQGLTSLTSAGVNTTRLTRRDAIICKDSHRKLLLFIHLHSLA
ncbi:hypothetical protein EV424DRAFT_1122949 [Suillus variegatus]|nr:hypothetical protein EV424DRAFT_1122949 [Suillus variegatus]